MEGSGREGRGRTILSLGPQICPSATRAAIAKNAQHARQIRNPDRDDVDHDCQKRATNTASPGYLAALRLGWGWADLLG